MKKEKQKSLRSQIKDTKIIYLLGDQASNKSFFFEFMDLQQQELNHQINVYVKIGQNLKSFQIYEFPVDKMVRNAMDLYLKMLPQPISIIYFIKSQGIQKDISDWIKILQKNGITAKIIFISDVTTYMERQKILTRLAKQFQANILDVIIFVKLEPYTFRRSFDRLQQIGMSIEYANCLKPTFGKKLMNSIQKFIKNIKDKKKQFFSRRQQVSVI